MTNSESGSGCFASLFWLFVSLLSISFLFNLFSNGVNKLMTDENSNTSYNINSNENSTSLNSNYNDNAINNNDDSIMDSTKSKDNINEDNRNSTHNNLNSNFQEYTSAERAEFALQSVETRSESEQIELLNKSHDDPDVPVYGLDLALPSWSEL